MGTSVVCTRLHVAPDGVSSKTRSALRLTLKTSTGGASTVGVSPGTASPVAPEGRGGREDQARPPGPTSKTARWDFGLLTRTATRPFTPTALARTESAPGTGSGADMVQPEPFCAHPTSSARCPAPPTVASSVVAPPEVSSRKTPVAPLPRPTVKLGPAQCHDPSVSLNRPPRPPRSQPVATSGAPAAENATAAIAVTSQEGTARRSAAVETSCPQEPRLLAAAKTVPFCMTASPTGVPDASIASASADRARAPGRKTGLQEAPPSLLDDSGENRSKALGSTPAATESPETPATRPPLSAVPSGVTSDQREDPGTA